MKHRSCAEKPDSELVRPLHGRFCSLTFKTTCQRIGSNRSESSARLQLACGMAVSFNHSRLSAFTRVHAARELHVTASAQSKCLSVSSRPQQGVSHPLFGRLSTLVILPAAWRQVRASENHRVSAQSKRLVSGFIRTAARPILLAHVQIVLSASSPAGDPVVKR